MGVPTATPSAKYLRPRHGVGATSGNILSFGTGNPGCRGACWVVEQRHPEMRCSSALRLLWWGSHRTV